MKLLTDGAWGLSSESDPRWNCSGSALVGGLVKPQAVKDAEERLRAELGEPPADLEWWYEKY